MKNEPVTMGLKGYNILGKREVMVKKTNGICAFCGKPIYQSQYDEHYHEDRWRHYVGADGKQAGHIAKPKQN